MIQSITADCTEPTPVEKAGIDADDTIDEGGLTFTTTTRPVVASRLATWEAVDVVVVVGRWGIVGAAGADAGADTGAGLGTVGEKEGRAGIVGVEGEAVVDGLGGIEGVVVAVVVVVVAETDAEGCGGIDGVDVTAAAAAAAAAVAGRGGIAGAGASSAGVGR